jgi:hypothetical protein
MAKLSCELGYHVKCKHNASKPPPMHNDVVNPPFHTSSAPPFSPSHFLFSLLGMAVTNGENGEPRIIILW